MRIFYPNQIGLVVETSGNLQVFRWNIAVFLNFKRLFSVYAGNIENMGRSGQNEKIA